MGPTARAAMPLFRLIPLTIITALVLLGLKVVEIIENGRQLKTALFVESVMAEEEPATAEPATASGHDASDAPAAEDQQAAEENGSHEASGEGKKPAEKQPAAVSAEPPAAEPAPRFTQREVDVLESLAERREKLEAWEKEMTLKENVLKATEQRIDQKIQEMQSLSDQIQKLLVAYNEEENAKIRSLVKVYESMKPKEAGRIFEEMDMSILLMVVDRMSERRVAPILASMSPQRAKAITEQLAAQQKLKPTLPPSAAPDDTQAPATPPL